MSDMPCLTNLDRAGVMEKVQDGGLQKYPLVLRSQIPIDSLLRHKKLFAQNYHSCSAGFFFFTCSF